MNTHDLSVISAVRYYLNRQLRDRTLMSISKESGVPYTTLSHFADGDVKIPTERNMEKIMKWYHSDFSREKL